MLSPSALPNIAWQPYSSIDSAPRHATAPAPNDAATQNAGSFQSAFAQASSSPSSGPAVTAPSGDSARNASPAKPLDKQSSPLLPTNLLASSGAASQGAADAAKASNSKAAATNPMSVDQVQLTTNPNPSIVKSLARTGPVQRAVKAEPSTPATQTIQDSGLIPAAAANPLAPTVTSGQTEAPSNPLPSLADDKSNSPVSASFAGGQASAAGFSSLKDLSGAAFAMHITTAATRQGSANQETGGQSNAGQNTATPNGENQTFSASNPTESGSGLSAPANPSATGALPIQPPMLFPMTTPVWSSTEAGAAANQPSSMSPAVSTSVEVNEIGSDGSDGAPQTVRTIQVQLAAGEGQGRVDLRMVEHAGGLSVSVRTADATLTKGLQENLPDLSARLAADKYQTHTFIPPASEAAGGGSSSGSSGQPSGQAQDQAGGRSFSQGGDGNSRQKDGQPSEQEAAWWRQLAALGKLSSSASHSVPNSVLGSPLSTVANPLANQ